MSRNLHPALRFLIVSLLTVIPSAFLTQCTSTSTQVAVDGALGTPMHDLPSHEYPFDENGDYREDWVRTPRRVSVKAPSSSGSSSSSSDSGSTARRQHYHTITKGDTLWGISRRYGVSVSALKQENGLKSDVIRPGETLRIP